MTCSYSCLVQRLHPHDLLAPHITRTIHRAAAVPLALAVNDTTTLHYSGRPAATGLGPIGNNADKTLGLHLHSLLAFTPQRQPLGLLDVQCWARDPAAFGGNRQRNRRPIEQKESAQWLRSYAALQTLAAPDRPAVLVRMQHNRGVEQSEQRLFERLARGLQRLADRTTGWKQAHATKGCA